MTGGMYLKGVTVHNHHHLLPSRLTLANEDKELFLKEDEDEEEIKLKKEDEKKEEKGPDQYENSNGLIKEEEEEDDEGEDSRAATPDLMTGAPRVSSRRFVANVVHSFSCARSMGYFYPLSLLLLSSRFTTDPPPADAGNNDNEEKEVSTPLLEVGLVDASASGDDQLILLNGDLGVGEVLLEEELSGEERQQMDDDDDDDSPDVVGRVDQLPSSRRASRVARESLWKASRYLLPNKKREVGERGRREKVFECPGKYTFGRRVCLQFSKYIFSQFASR